MIDRSSFPLLGLSLAKEEKTTVHTQLVPRKTCQPMLHKDGNQAGSLWNPRPGSEFLLVRLQLKGSYHREQHSTSSFESCPEQQGLQPQDLHGEEMRTCAESGSCLIPLVAEEPQ